VDHLTHRQHSQLHESFLEDGALHSEAAVGANGRPAFAARFSVTDLVSVLVFLGIWILLQAVILPRLGVAT
jgi:hypothetical protein